MAVIAVCALSLAGVAFMKGDFTIFAKSSSSSNPQYTYAQALADAQSEVSTVTNLANISTSSDDSDIAMVDPNSAAGQVLGDSTGTDDSVLPDSKEVLTDDKMAAVKIRLLPDTTAANVAQYQQDVFQTEMADGADVILLDATTADQPSWKDASDRSMKLVKDLLAVKVPSELERYDKLNMIYFLEYKALADANLGVAGAPDTQGTGVAIFSLTDELNSIKTDIFNKYGVQL